MPEEEKEKKEILKLLVTVEDVKKERHNIEETLVSASDVSDIREGLVTGSSVAQARKEIEKEKESSKQSEKK